MPEEWVYWYGEKDNPREWRKINKFGKTHNEDRDEETGLLLPAIKEWDMDGDLSSEKWAINGCLHNEDRDPETGYTLPALISYDGNGPVERLWTFSDKWHNADRNHETGEPMPCWVKYNSRDGSIVSDMWAIATLKWPVSDPKNPAFLAALEQWENNHHLPATKSALKTGP